PSSIVVRCPQEVRMAHPLFTPEIRLMLEENNEAALAELCDALHPATVGEALGEGFTVEEIWRILSPTSIENQATIFEYLALERLRLQAPDTETIYYVYVVNEQRKLLGVVSLRDVLLKPRQVMVRDFMETQIVTVKATDDREKVAQEIARYDLLAIPVVDAENRLVGIVTHDDVIDVVVSEATEDLQRQAGVGPLTENYLEASFVKVWWHRAVWLAALFIAE